MKNKVSVPRDNEVEVQTKIQVAQEKWVLDKGKAILHKIGETAELYYDLVMGIRQQKIAPKLVSDSLSKLGFNRVRVSEINRVANASDKLFKDYEARLLGFNKVLDLARSEKKGEPKLLTDAASLLHKEGVLTEEDLEEAVRPDESSAASVGAGGRKRNALKEGAKKLIALAAKAGREKYVYRFKDWPYQLEIVRDAKTGPSVGDDVK